MKKLYWAPRILGIIFTVLFIWVFLNDIYENGIPGLRDLSLGLFIIFALTLILLIALKREKIGGIIYCILGIATIWFFIGIFPLIIGALFLWGAKKNKQGPLFDEKDYQKLAIISFISGILGFLNSLLNSSFAYFIFNRKEIPFGISLNLGTIISAILILFFLGILSGIFSLKSDKKNLSIMGIILSVISVLINFIAFFLAWMVNIE
jgi:hypothetical protein